MAYFVPGEKLPDLSVAEDGNDLRPTEVSKHTNRSKIHTKDKDEHIR